MSLHLHCPLKRLGQDPSLLHDSFLLYKMEMIKKKKSSFLSCWETLQMHRVWMVCWEPGVACDVPAAQGAGRGGWSPLLIAESGERLLHRLARGLRDSACTMLR